MLRRHIWKLSLSVALVLWAIFTLTPLKDQDFGEYVKASYSARPAEFSKLMGEVSSRVQSGRAPSVYVALKQIGIEQKLDLSEFFPDIRLETTLKNVEKRNAILLDELLRRSKGKLQRGLDLKGGVAFTLEVDPNVASSDNQQVRQEKLTKAIEIIGNRVNGLGVSEPIIRAVGTNRIEVQLPGVSTKDNPEVVNSLRKPARLDFKMVHPTIAPPQEAPPGYEHMTLDQEGRTGAQSYTEELYVKTRPEMTGEGVADAYPTMDEFGRFKIILKFTKAGGKEFADVTRAIAEEGARTGRRGRLAIVLDGKLYSAPGVEKEIAGGSAEISGSFTQREAVDLSNVLNNPLDLPLQIKEQYEVSPTLATDAIASGVRASVIGTALVAGFMITYYSIGGLVAVATLAVNLLIILGVMASFGATMTLPGLAGMVLTVGMAVDANILIFERMREELNLGKTLKTALVSGYDKAFMTIVDAHVTQLAICAVMIWLGTGPIKGFGVTLAIGVFSTMISVLITSHMVMEWLIDGDLVKRMPMLHLLKNVRTDFVKYGKACFIGSWILVFSGLAVVLVKGDKIYGVDFAGGDVVSVAYQQKLDPAAIRKVADAIGTGEVNPTFISQLGGGGESLKLETAYGKSDALFAALQKAYPEAGLDKTGTTQIGPTIGKEIELNALKALLASMVIVLLYVAFRFEFGFGIGAVVASVHDILMTIGIFVMFGHQFSAPMVAAILAIAGYSINDTIVVFDRIREELKLDPSSKLRDVINNAIRKVFARSIMTSLTAFLAALSLYLFGSGVIHDLSFTFLVGIITGTFSSIYIAAPVFYWWHKGDRKHVEAHQDIAPKYEWAGSSRASE